MTQIGGSGASKGRNLGLKVKHWVFLRFIHFRSDENVLHGRMLLHRRVISRVLRSEVHEEESTSQVVNSLVLVSGDWLS